MVIKIYFILLSYYISSKIKQESNNDLNIPSTDISKLLDSENPLKHNENPEPVLESISSNSNSKANFNTVPKPESIQKSKLKLSSAIKSKIMYSYGDKGRNWTNSCLTGLQSPIDIVTKADPSSLPKSSIESSTIDPIPLISFNYTSIHNNSNECIWHLSFENSNKALIKLSLRQCTQDNYNKIYTHPPWSIQDSMEYDLKEIYVKFPSEHSIDSYHYFAEFQFYHYLNKENSILNEQNKEKVDEGKYSMLVYSILVDQGDQHSNNPWVKQIINTVHDYGNDVIETDIPEFDHTMFERPNIGFYDDELNFDYSYYVGSKSIPSCTNDIIWVVNRKPIVMTKAQKILLYDLTRLQPRRDIMKNNNRKVWKGKYSLNPNLTKIKKVDTKENEPVVDIYDFKQK